MCDICGQPSFVRCNCVSAQPFCDQCSPNTNCTSITDSQCVIYHFASPGYIPPPTRLINMGMPNGSSAEAIFERIDTLFGAGFFRPWNPGNTNTLKLHLDGPGLPVILRGDVQLSGQSGNTIVANSDGLFVPPFNPDYRVKVDSSAPPRYLFDSMVGGTDGCVSITVNDIGGLINIQPFLNMQCFADRVCSSSNSIKSELGTCLLNSSLSVLDTSSIHLALTPISGGLQLTANSKISATGGNIIIINPDGLYASGGTGFTINNNTNGNIITANGTSGSADGQPTLTYLNGTLTAPIFSFTMALVSAQEIARSLFQATLHLNQANYGVNSSNIASTHSQLYISPDVNTIFGRGHFLAGTLGELVPNSSTGFSATGLLSSVCAKISIFGNNNYTDIASVRTAYPGTDTNFSGIYTGTITNYYGVFIGDTNADENGISHARVTNSYAIFQEGSTLKNSFATAVVVTSDARVKTNIEDYKRGLAEIEKVNVVKYNFKEQPDSDKHVGVIAQNVEETIPEAIHTESNAYYKIEDFKKLDNDTLVYTLINAVKELSQLNKDLNNRIAAIENRFTPFT